MKPEYEKLPYRAGVGLMILNRDNRIFVGERFEHPGSWQLPQGGIDEEDGHFKDAVFRELYEETGIRNAEIIDVMDDWQYYDFPDHLIAKLWDANYRGQKQKWVALRFTGEDSEVNLHAYRFPEFQSWRWATAEETLDLIVPFKRKTYETVFEYFEELFT